MQRLSTPEVALHFLPLSHVNSRNSDILADFQNRQNIPRSIFATPDHALHKLRKAPLLPLFSKKRISDFQPVIREKLDLLCEKIDSFVANGKPFAVNRAITAFSGDVMTTYVFGKSYDNLESPDFAETFHEPFMCASEGGHVALQFKWMYPLMERVPLSLVKKMQPLMFPVIKLAIDFDEKLKAIKAGEAKENPDHPTILFELVRSDLPPKEKEIGRLNEEAQLLVAAGAGDRVMGTQCHHFLCVARFKNTCTTAEGACISYP